jgi:hypothetical protein
VSNGYLCSFEALSVKTVLLDETIRDPENPPKESIVVFETKAMRLARGKWCAFCVVWLYEVTTNSLPVIHHAT